MRMLPVKEGHLAGNKSVLACNRALQSVMQQLQIEQVVHVTQGTACSLDRTYTACTLDA